MNTYTLMIKRARLIMIAATLSCSALVATAQPAWAEEIACRGTLDAVTVDNLRVPPDATCTLNGTRVQGSIVVERNAQLDATDIQVVGNVQAEGARAVNVSGSSTIGGSVQVKQGGSASILTARVNADIQFDSNTAALVASGNRVGGSIQVFQNTGGVNISQNRVDGNLQCKENVPPPVGGGNVVQGSKEDQCKSLSQYFFFIMSGN